MNINTDNVKSKIKEVADHWGAMMPMMTMEECGELIQAISKLERCGGTTWLNNVNSHYVNEYRQQVIKEIADVNIAMNALMVHYGIDAREVAIAIGNKLLKDYLDIHTKDFEDLNKLIEAAFSDYENDSQKKQCIKRVKNAFRRNDIHDLSTLKGIMRDPFWYDHIRGIGKDTAKRLERAVNGGNS